MSYEATAEVPTLVGRLRPLVAARALAAFMRNPDDTAQVFRVVRALDGRTAERAFLRFCATAAGRRVLTRERTLGEVLADRAPLALLPPGTLGREYVEFCERERISVEALLAAAVAGGIAGNRLDAGRGRYRRHVQAMHDLLHVVTGYGTDELGETCLLAFTWRQNGSRGLLPLFAGLTLRQLAWLRTWRVVGAVREATALAARAHGLAVQDWEALLGRPVEEIRMHLGVGSPGRYLATRQLAAAADRRRSARLVATGVAVQADTAPPGP